MSKIVYIFLGCIVSVLITLSLSSHSNLGFSKSLFSNEKTSEHLKNENPDSSFDSTAGIVLEIVSAPFSIVNEDGYVLENIRISNPDGPCIHVLESQNIIIKNSWIGPCKDEGILVEESHFVEVTQNYFESVSTGLYARDLSQAINIHHNEFKNMLGPFPRGQIVQLNDVDGGGSKINYNYVINLPDQSYPEDAINLFNSDGLPDDKIEIIGNYINGGGPSLTGGGIMTGDNNGSHVLVSNNVLINPGQYGIAVVSGHHINIVENKIYSSQQSFSNVGVYIWNQYDESCYDNTFVSNQVYWINKEGEANHWWAATTGKDGVSICSNTIDDSNQWGSTEISEAMLPPSGAGITDWNGPLTAATSTITTMSTAIITTTDTTAISTTLSTN